MCSFLETWKTTVRSLGDEVLESTLCGLLLDQMEKSTRMHHAVETYREAAEGFSQKTYAFLIQQMENYVEGERQQRNREQMVKHLTGGNVITQAAPAVCRFLPAGKLHQRKQMSLRARGR